MGQDWSDRILDRPSNDSVLQDVRKDLFCAISSGEVTTLLSCGDDFKPMQAAETQRLSFEINLAADCIELRDPEDRWACQICAHELDVFLEKYRQTRLGMLTETERQEQCSQWLLQLTKKGKKRKGALTA